MFQEQLKELVTGKVLSKDEAIAMMDDIMDGTATPSQIAAFLSIIAMRGETVDELIGFVKSMRAHAKTFTYDEEVIDTVGTGGDGASTFNISTASAILLSSLGVNVAKHGNRSVSSKSGSADALEALGISIQSTPEEALASLKRTHMCFLFAPLYHASMKHAAGPRKELGFRTVFNLLGPLTNPAQAERQLLGVFNQDAAKKYADALLDLGTRRSLVVNGSGGLDELSISGATDAFLVEDGKVAHFSVAPEDVGLERGRLKDIQVENPRESAELIEAIFAGRTANQSAINIVLLNAGAGLYVYGRADTIAEGVHDARRALEDGLGLKQLNLLRSEAGAVHHA